MENKKIIITLEQFKRLSEEQNQTQIQIQAKGNTPGEYANALKNSQSQINAAQQATNGDVEAVISGPKEREDLPPMVANVPQGSDPSQIMQNQNPDYINHGGSVVVKGAGFGGKQTFESKKYNKKQIERARLKILETQGKHLTKKIIKESVVNPDSRIEQFKNQISSEIEDNVSLMNSRINDYKNNFFHTIQALSEIHNEVIVCLSKNNINIINMQCESDGDGTYFIKYYIDWTPSGSDFDSNIYNELDNLGSSEIYSYYNESKNCIELECNFGTLYKNA